MVRNYDEIKKSTQRQAESRAWFVEQYFPKNGVGAEIGVLYGQFSEVILRAAKPRLLYLVDPWDHDDKYGDRTPEMMEEMHQETREKFFGVDTYRDSCDIEIMKMTSRNFFDSFPWTMTRSVKFDFIYIDGSHEKADVAADLRGAWRVICAAHGA